jgi:rubredoxin
MGVVLPFKRPEWRIVTNPADMNGYQCLVCGLFFYFDYNYRCSVCGLSFYVDDGIRMETDTEYAARIKRLES